MNGLKSQLEIILSSAEFSDIVQLFLFFFILNDLKTNCTFSDQFKEWAHQICFTTCAVNLMAQLYLEIMTFAPQMIWQIQGDDTPDSLFCLISISGFSAKTKIQN